MKVIIAGSRSFKGGIQQVQDIVDKSGFKVTEVVSGRAEGADLLGEFWADFNDIDIQSFPADWDTYGKKAGPIRNVKMAQYADALIAIWDGKSKGTKHMIKVATNIGMSIYVHRFDSEEKC